MNRAFIDPASPFTVYLPTGLPTTSQDLMGPVRDPPPDRPLGNPRAFYAALAVGSVLQYAAGRPGLGTAIETGVQYATSGFSWQSTKVDKSITNEQTGTRKSQSLETAATVTRRADTSLN